RSSPTKPAATGLASTRSGWRTPWSSSTRRSSRSSSPRTWPICARICSTRPRSPARTAGHTPVILARELLHSLVARVILADLANLSIDVADDDSKTITKRPHLKYTCYTASKDQKTKEQLELDTRKLSSR